MKKEIEENTKGKVADLRDKKITRKEAIRKSGYIAVSAATMMILLGSAQKAHASSPAPVDPWTS
jgi:hypothetical protein